MDFNMKNKIKNKNRLMIKKNNSEKLEIIENVYFD